MADFSPTSAPVGTPVWADLASSDIAASVSFYGAVLGWSCVPYLDFDDHSDFSSNGRAVGRLAPKIGDVPDAWTVYLKVDDIQATVAAADAAGGRVLQEPEAFADEGSRALLEDPSGAEVAVWEARSFDGFEAANGRVPRVGSNCTPMISRPPSPSTSASSVGPSPPSATVTVSGWSSQAIRRRPVRGSTTPRATRSRPTHSGCSTSLSRTPTLRQLSSATTVGRLSTARATLHSDGCRTPKTRRVRRSPSSSCPPRQIREPEVPAFRTVLH